MKKMRRRLLGGVALLLLFGHGSGLGLHRRGRRSLQRELPGGTLDKGGFKPEELLCKHGKKMQAWCVDWLKCIKKGTGGETGKVMEAWKPAECEQYCGVQPVTNPLEGQGLLQTGSSSGDPEKAASPKECMESCKNFQESLSTCVGTILYEPGKLATMGPKKRATEPPEVCTVEKTPCMPDLRIKAQRCHSAHSKRRLYGADNAERLYPGYDKKSCEQILSDYDDCKDCPALSQAGGSAFASFVGGCMDQLNAYWQATHPRAGLEAIPGATGCPVHD